MQKQTAWGKHSQVIFATEELAVICIGFLQRLH